MTKKLEELFELDSTDEQEIEIAEKQPSIDPTLISTDTLNAIEKIENALPQVKDLSTSDHELDELSDLAKNAFNNLMDLGMQTDPRFSAEIFSVGGVMLGHALTAKTAKINKKLKMVDLQLKKAELDRKLSLVKPEKEEPTPLGVGKVMDRNELLKMLMETGSTKNDNKDK